MKISLFICFMGLIPLAISQELFHKRWTILSSNIDTLHHIDWENWQYLKPISKEYDNLKTPDDQLCLIDYVLSEVPEFSSHNVLGTFWLVKSHLPLGDTLHFSTSPRQQFSATQHLTIKQDSSYLGCLTGLLGVPFVLPPRNVPKEGHQTDLGLGTDCAELAICGQRQLGFNIPYCGPDGILRYLDEVKEVQVGDIVHFGFQVSVLYQDNGEKGVVDGDDLFIHAHENQVKIERFASSSLINRHFRTYRWKNNLPRTHQ